MLKTIAPLIFLSLLVGCAPESRSYSVIVKNDTATPLTLDLCKDGPPPEEGWASPEEIADGRITLTPQARLGYFTLQPGRSQGAKDVSGQFNAGVHAMLRVYRGADLQVREMIAIKPGPDRQDVVLKPGDNHFVVHDDKGNLSIDPAGR